MKKRKPAIVILLLCMQSVFCQNSNTYRHGSALKLEGNIYTLCCFISSNETWTYSEKANICNQTNEATAWIKIQASRYNIPVNFKVGTYGLKDDIRFAQIERGTGSGKEKTDMISLVLKKIGYKSPLDFYNWVLKNTQCTNVQVIIYAKGYGTGYAMTYGGIENKEMYFVEGAILYEKYWTGSTLKTSSIAHEILHLYGAWDLYNSFQQTQEKEDMAKKLFPNSIMLRTAEHIQDLSVDEVTAWLIGWNNKTQAWYEWFKPR
jgi:hypothetical protein